MNKNCTRLIIFLFGAALAFGGQSLFAQLRIVGAISGTVHDPSGAVVPGAKVALKDELTGIGKETVATNAGTFLFPDLSLGLYEVTITAPGFQASVISHVSVSTSQTTDLSVKLVVGQVTETVVVEGVAPVLETTTQLVTTTQTLKVITELPLIGRSNALALARLMPGASPPSGGSTRYNNLPGGAVNVTVDGINNASNGWKSGGTVFYMTVPVRLGAVEEISVETGGLGADSGAQSGANIKFVTRRGGNKYHGSAFFEPTSEKFSANSWSRNAQGLPRVRSRRFDYGANFGGPILPSLLFKDRFGNLREKMFIFINFERSFAPLYTARTISVLTPDAQKGIYTYLLSGTTDQLRSVNVMDIAASKGAPVKLDPVAQSIIALNNQIPKYATKVIDTDFNRDTYTWDAENNDYAYFPTLRFDYYITPKQQLTYSWIYRHNWQAGERRLPIPETSRTNPFRLGYFIWSAALQSTLTPRMVNEFRYGVQHSGDSNMVAEYGSYYTYNNTPMRIGGTLPFGPTVPFIDQQNTTGRHFITTIYDTLTLSRGQHNITMGASYRRTDWKDLAEVYPIPTYSTGTPSGDPLGINSIFNTTTIPGIVNTDLGNPQALYNLLTGRISQSNFRAVVNPTTLKYDGFINPTWTRSNMGGVYVQDRWRIRPGLTLNFGLRWELQGDMYDVMKLTASPDLPSIFGPSTKLFAPGTLSGNNNPTIEVGRQTFKPDYLNIAPNVGFAWNPNFKEGLLGKLFGGSKTVLRGSYGIIYYDEGTQMFAANLGNNAGKAISANTIPGQGVLPAFTTLSDLVANPLTKASFTFATTEYKKTINQADQTFSSGFNGMNPDLRAPYTINWNFGVQRELMKNTVLEVKYVGTVGHGLWRTSNLNEVNIFENGFLQEFKNAQSNLNINIANGKGNTFANNGLTGQSALPIFDAAFGPRGGVAAIAASSGYSSTSFVTNLQNGEAGSLASTLATNRNYVCRMFGSNLSPCLRIDPLYNAPGTYPVNFFLLNPYVAGRINYVDGTGWNSYNGMQVQLRRRYSQGLDWTVNYTWSKSLTNLPADSATQDVDWTTQRNTSLDRRVSSFDLRHVLQTFGTYELPVGRGRRLTITNPVLNHAFGGWTIGSIVVFNTGAPAQLTGGFNTVNNSNNSATGGVRLGPGITLEQVQKMFDAERVRLTGRVGVTDLQRLAVDPRLVGTDGRANSTYLIPNRTPGEFGQLLFIRNKNSFTWNASVTKNFIIREGVRFQFFMGINNVLNHPSWGLGSTNVYSTSFGVTGGASGTRSMSMRGTLSF